MIVNILNHGLSTMVSEIRMSNNVMSVKCKM